MKILVTVLLCLPAIALCNLEDCMDLVTPPGEGTNAYRSYRYTVDAGGTCNAADLVCDAKLPNTDFFRDRSWFLADNKDYHGRAYSPDFLQLYNVQCPAGSYLHLFPQRLATEPAPFGQSCETVDFVRVIAEGEEDLICGDSSNIDNSNIFNAGLGRIVSDGQATVEFCTNSNSLLGFGAVATRNETDGFTVRATCIDPRNFLLPGCTDYPAVKLWDRAWTDQQNSEYEKPEAITVPHKRSIARSVRKAQSLSRRWANRAKRFVSLQSFEFSEGQTVTYENGKFTFEFNNGSSPFCPNGLFFCVFASSELIGTRQFFRDAPFVFTGPGKLELDNKIANLRYFVNDTDPAALEALLLPGNAEMQIVNRIYDYIYNCWVAVYPVLDNGSPNRGRSFPLPRANNIHSLLPARFGQIKAANSLGFLQEEFEDIPGNMDSCYRATLIRQAPALDSNIIFRLFDFCQFFYNSCNPLLRIACRELVQLDPSTSGKK